MHLCVSGIQMPVTTSIEHNLIALLRALEQASAAGAHILLTPEGSLSGYTPHFDPSEVEAALTQFTNLAARLQVGLALGTCYREVDGLIYDQLRFYSRQGLYLGAHSKILLCGTLTDPPVGEINDYATSELMVLISKASRSVDWSATTCGPIRNALPCQIRTSASNWPG